MNKLNFKFILVMFIATKKMDLRENLKDILEMCLVKFSLNFQLNELECSF